MSTPRTSPALPAAALLALALLDLGLVGLAVGVHGHVERTPPFVLLGASSGVGALLLLAAALALLTRSLPAAALDTARGLALVRFVLVLVVALVLAATGRQHLLVLALVGLQAASELYGLTAVSAPARRTVPTP
ncbi:MAG: hypothetical protein JWN17_1364 [Frankiales bacterium]|nr:hypothetical protein [Frankiales bacterium]